MRIHPGAFRSAALGFVLVACGGDSTTDPVVDDTPPIQTDRQEYVLTLENDVYSFTLVATTTNRTSETVFLAPCTAGDPTPRYFTFRTDFGDGRNPWEFTDVCDPVFEVYELEPGQTRTDAIRFEIENEGWTFEDRQGLFRLDWAVWKQAEPVEGGYQLSGAVGANVWISNEFRVADPPR